MAETDVFERRLRAALRPPHRRRPDRLRRAGVRPAGRREGAAPARARRASSVAHGSGVPRARLGAAAARVAARRAGRRSPGRRLAAPARKSRPSCRRGPGVRLSARIDARRAGAGRPGPAARAAVRWRWRSIAGQGSWWPSRALATPRRDVDVRRVHEHLDADASATGSRRLGTGYRLVYDVDSDLTIGRSELGPREPQTMWAYDLEANTWTEKGVAPDRVRYRPSIYDPVSGLVVALVERLRRDRPPGAVDLRRRGGHVDPDPPGGSGRPSNRRQRVRLDASVDRLVGGLRMRCGDVGAPGPRRGSSTVRTAPGRRSGAVTPDVLRTRRWSECACDRLRRGRGADGDRRARPVAAVRRDRGPLGDPVRVRTSGRRLVRDSPGVSAPLGWPTTR